MDRFRKFIKFVRREPRNKTHYSKPEKDIWQINLIKSIEKEERVRIKLTNTSVPHYRWFFDEIRLPLRNIENASKKDLLSTTYHEVGHAKTKIKSVIDFFAILMTSLVSIASAFIALGILALRSSPFWGMFIAVYLLILVLILPLIMVVVLLRPIRGAFVGSVIFTLYLLIPIILAPFSSFIVVFFSAAFSALFAASVRLKDSVSEWRADIFAAKKIGAERHFKAKPWWTKARRKKITSWQRFWFKIFMPYYVCSLEKRISIISKHLK